MSLALKKKQNTNPLGTTVSTFILKSVKLQSIGPMSLEMSNLCLKQGCLANTLSHLEIGTFHRLYKALIEETLQSNVRVNSILKPVISRSAVLPTIL